jgi:hypothetical protein
MVTVKVEKILGEEISVVRREAQFRGAGKTEIETISVRRWDILKTRKGRLIWLGIFFLLFLTMTILYFTNQSFTAEQDRKMIQLLIYTSSSFIVVLSAEWFGAFEKDGPRYKKYIYGAISVIWLLCLWILFRDMI